MSQEVVLGALVCLEEIALHGSAQLEGMAALPFSSPFTSLYIQLEISSKLRLLLVPRHRAMMQHSCCADVLPALEGRWRLVFSSGTLPLLRYIPVSEYLRIVRAQHEVDLSSDIGPLHTKCLCTQQNSLIYLPHLPQYVWTRSNCTDVRSACGVGSAVIFGGANQRTWTSRSARPW